MQDVKVGAFGFEAARRSVADQAGAGAGADVALRYAVADGPALREVRELWAAPCERLVGGASEPRGVRAGKRVELLEEECLVGTAQAAVVGDDGRKATCRRV
ncbi:hypothetical protein [Streptomyces sp. NPDC126503]|uniref:hypothetical protein n=1 Tax=Streptomyces sp. NPDC126503 TaxID=3155315 RepID=UPI00332509E7